MNRIAPLALVTWATAALVGCGDTSAPAAADAAAADLPAAEDAGADLPAAEDAGAGGDDARTPPTSCATDADCPTAACLGARCVSGACVAVLAADDSTCDPTGDGCVLGATCTAGVCAGGESGCGCTSDAACAALDDGDACTGTLRCVAKAAPDGSGGRCEVDPTTVVTCEASGDPCVTSACDPATGTCSATPVSGSPPCDDLNPCTGGTRCSGGACGGGVAICPCASSKDCDKLNDPATWRCSGTWYCDATGAAPTCKLDTASVVSCPAGDAGGCVQPMCDPADGGCKTAPRPDKTPCEDGSICTGGDHCLQGACTSGPNICGCKSQADCDKQDDGDACNGTLYCDVLSPSPSCKPLPGSSIDCDTSDDGACETTTCDPKSGACKTSPKSAPGGTPIACDDGNPCTSGDACASGSCQAGTPTCPCTTQADCAAKQPKNKCLGSLYCDLTTKSCTINPATVVVCPTAADTACLKNRCEPTTGVCAKQAQPDDAPCDADGNPCTAGDVCKKGTCAAGTNVCSCEKNADCGKFEDGDVCNGALYCDTTKQPLVCEVNQATVLTCPTVDDTACAKRVCAKKTGACPLVPVFELEPCDADGNPCTAGDRCLSGACVAGTNLCGCQQDADCAAKEDGDACNGTLICDKSKQPFSCQVNPVTVPDCSGLTATACQVVACQKKDGKCVVLANEENLACSDGDPCTLGDTCQAGVCKGGADLCTCKVDKDCAQPGDACQGVAVCRKDVVPHVCGVAPGSAITCDAPGGACFVWACTAGLCVKTAKGAQGICDDGDACTATSACSGTACEGTPKSCDDGKACTIDVCAASGACTHSSPAGLPCSDGDACTTGDTCVAGGCVAGSSTLCDDKEPCTTDGCAAATGCTHVAVADQTPCTLPEGLDAVCLSSTCTLTAP